MSDSIETEASSSSVVSAQSDSARPVSRNAGVSRRSFVAPLSQVALVLLGVLLALAADRWNANRERAQRAGLALAAIHRELLENQSRIERAMLHHRTMRDTLSKLVSASRLPDPQLYNSGMLNPALINSTAWESAKDSGILGELSYDLVLKLSRLYASQERYRSLGQALAEAFYVEIMRSGHESIARDRFANFLVLEQDFANREYLILEQYGEVLALLPQPVAR